MTRTARCGRWALREITILRDTWAVLAELPPTGVDDDTAAAMEAAAAALLEQARYRGGAVVHFALDADGSFAVTEVDTDGRATHAGVEERTGAGILTMRLRADLGGALPPTEPQGEGWTVEARLLAHDPDRGYAPTGGRVEVMSLPVGTGVRVDAGLRAGDVVDARLDPVLATVTSWGRNRTEALHRLRRALERTSVVLSGGATNRTGLIAVLGSPAVLEGPPPPQWYAEQLAVRRPGPRPRPGGRRRRGDRGLRGRPHPGAALVPRQRRAGPPRAPGTRRGGDRPRLPRQPAPAAGRPHRAGPLPRARRRPLRGRSSTP